MPEPIRKTENALSIHQILELLSRPQKDEAAENLNLEQPSHAEKIPSRDLVLRVINGLKQA
jgi:hypothetical protein